MIDLRDIIDAERERQGLTVEDLARRTTVAGRDAVHRFLGGRTSGSAALAGELLGLVGLEVRPVPRSRRRRE